MKKHQSGFAAIELVLVFVVLGITGFTGWFVLHAKQSTDETLNNTASSQPALQSKKAATATDTKQKYLNITEWGVKLPLDEEHKDLVYCYEQRDSGERYVYFSATSLGGIKKLDDGSCGETVAALSRYKIGDTTYVSGQPTTVTEDWVKDAPKIGEYYYFLEASHVRFSEDASVDAKADSYESFLAEAKKNIQAL